MPILLARLAPAAARGSTRLVVLATVGVIALGACSPATAAPTASPASASSVPSSAPSSSAAPSLVASAAPSPSPSQAATLLLEVRTGGGFINPAAGIGALPTVVVDTTGRIYTPGLAPDGSNPLIPVVAVRDTGATGGAAILAAAKAAGLVDGTGGGGVMADTGAAIFTLEVNGTEVVTKVAGGGPGGGPGGPGASGKPGAAALEFLTKLTDPTTPWGGASAPATTYAPTEYRVWVAPDASLAGGATNAPWPLTADLATFGTSAATNLGVDGLRSGVVSGADAVTLATALAKIESGTDLTAKGAQYRVWVEPLLPVAVGG